MVLVLATQTYPEQPPDMGALMLGALLIGAGAIVFLVARIRGDFSGRRYRPAGLSIGAALALAGSAVAGILKTNDWHQLLLAGFVLAWPASKLYQRWRRPPQRPTIVPPPPLAPSAHHGAWTAGEPNAWAPTLSVKTTGPRTVDARRRPLLFVGALLVVMAVRFATHGSLLSGHHASTSTQQTIALAYADAIVAFEHDTHRPPLLGTPDWPVPLNGPVSPTGHPYLARIPEAADGYTVWQTRSRSGSFPSPESAEVPVIAPPANRVIQYVPYGRTWDFDTESYGYEGYLVLVKPGDAARYAEASGDPPTVRLP